jgi:hypothetical protein
MTETVRKNSPKKCPNTSLSIFFSIHALFAAKVKLFYGGSFALTKFVSTEKLQSLIRADGRCLENKKRLCSRKTFSLFMKKS